MTTAERATAAAREHSVSLPRASIALGALLGVALRWYTLASPLGGFDSDEAVSALVSVDVREGRFPAFIPTARAGGTALAYPRALAFMLFGQGELIAKLCEVAMFAAACLMVWRLGRRFVDDRFGQVAALILWVFPAAAVWESTKVRLYYMTAIFFVAAGFVAILRVYALDRSAVPPWRDAALVGFCGGLCWWNHPMGLYAFVPAFAWLVACRPRLVQRALPVAGGFAVGALPWIGFNARHGWVSLKQPLPPAESTLRVRFEGFFRGVLPRLLGLRDQYGGPWFFSPWLKILYIALLMAALWRLATWTGAHRMLTAVAVAFPVLFAIPRNSVLNSEPRYGMPLLVVISLLEAAFVLWITRRRAVLVTGCIALLSLFSALALHHLIERTEPQRVEAHVLRPVPTDDLWHVIEQRQIPLAFADYWLGYRLVFEDRAPIEIIPLAADYYGLAGKHQEGSAIGLFYRDSACAAGWIDVLTGAGFATATEIIGDFVIVSTPTPVPAGLVAAAMIGRC